VSAPAPPAAPAGARDGSAGTPRRDGPRATPARVDRDAAQLANWAWPEGRLVEAIERLARHERLVTNEGANLGTPRPPGPAQPGPTGGGAAQTGAAAAPHTAAIDGGGLDTWLRGMAWRLGIELEPSSVTLSGLRQSLASAGPALVVMPGSQPRCLVLLRSRGVRLRLLDPTGRVRRLPADRVSRALAAPAEAPLAGETAALLERLGLGNANPSRATRLLIAERLADTHITTMWLVRLPAGAPFGRQLRAAGLVHRAAVLAAAHAAQYLVWIASWWAVGRGALAGRLDPGWLTAWGLLLVTLVPLRALVTREQGRLAIGAGALLKQRLLEGALRLDPEDVRRQGAGGLLGRVLESEAVEELTLSGGVLGVMALVELVMTAAVLAVGAGPSAAVLLALWTVLALALAARYLARRRTWALTRLGLTHELVERMVGHRTRLAQEPPAQWHAGEDEAVERYLEQSRHMDRAGATLAAVVPRGWLVASVLALLPGFLLAGRGGPALAVSIGGILLGYRAFEKLVAGLWSLGDAWIAWRQVQPLFAAAARPLAGEGAVPVAIENADGTAASPVVEASDVTFRYPGREDAVLRGCALQVAAGDRVLLGGASGGGKSTLVSLLAGLRAPGSGLVLAHGLDLATLGPEGWRRAVAVAPQFHENHVLTETFAFNLLMGRRWPASPDDIREAETVCRELGLGPLIERMPAGLLQTVGDTGWQLSHGERSRLFIARALLQRADLVVLDESFAALDPPSLEQALTCVLHRARTVLVVAHP
jgi:ATP-binding cassette, subfamily B, bacterial